MTVLLRRNLAYARLWSGDAVSMLGSQATALALPMTAILLLHASAWQLGLLTAASWVPYLGGLVIGTVMDRVPAKQAVLVWTNVIGAVALASIPIAYLSGRLGFGLLLAVALILGLGGVVSATVYQSFFVRLVRREDTLEATSLNSTARSVTSVVGPPAAGGLIQLLGAPVTLLVDSCASIISAIMIGTVRAAPPRPVAHGPGTGGGSILREAILGARTLFRDPWLASPLWVTTLLNIANFAIMPLLLIFATRTLALAPGAFGVAQGIGACGGVLGAVFAARLSGRIGLFRAVVAGAVLFCLPFVVIALIPAAWATAAKVAALAACAFVTTAAIMLYDVVINSVMITAMPEQLRGRLVGAFSSINYGIRPFAALAGGAAAGTLGLRLTIAIAAGIGLLAVIPLARSPLRGHRSLSEIDERELREQVAADPPHRGRRSR